MVNQKDKEKNKDVASYGAKGMDINMSVSPFGQNRAAEIAYSKAERLVLATHLVTNFVPENEPVRENVRYMSQDLLPLVMGLRDGLRSAGPNHISEVSAHLRKILSLLDVLHASGFLSNMNLEVLKSAYADLARFLRNSEDGVAAESLELEDEYFMAVTDIPRRGYSQGQKEIVKDKSIKDIPKGHSNGQGEVKDKLEESGPVNKGALRPQSLRARKRVSNRRMAILDIVSKRGPVHIKDIASEIAEVGEKTIQRELAKLVKDDVIKKEGTKRWTTYSVVV